MIYSSPSSTESSFREVDEVSLQTQTRKWLGEVLNSRLNEDLHLSDLLQDGEILFEVSKVVWNLLLIKCMELRHLKHKYGPFGCRRSSGRYRPYSNVDSFIKICKILGLSGIDLFSPSDVVEKRNIRKVCICIRALSKKARSKQLSVPDFDMVIYSVAMPKNMVGLIRKNLESSQCTSSSSSYSSRMVSEMKLKQENLYALSNGNDNYSSSEESDEAESRYMGEKSFSSAGKVDFADGVNTDLENSLEGQCLEEFKHESASLLETVQPFCKQHLDRMSSFGGISHANNDARCSRPGNCTGIANIEFALENDYSVVGDSSCVNDGESNYISNYLAFSDLMVHAADGRNSIIHDGEDNMFDFFVNVDSQGLASSNGRSFLNGDEDMEVSSTTSMSSVLGRLLNLEFDDQFDEDDSSSANDHSSVSKEQEAENRCKVPFVFSGPTKVGTFETNDETLLLDSREAQSKMTDKCELLCGTRTRNPENHSFCPEKRDNMVLSDDNHESILFNEDEDNVSSDRLETISDINEAQEDAYVAYDIQDTNILICLKSVIKKIFSSLLTQDRSISRGRKDASLQIPPEKHDQGPLLRTVVKGTAIAGFLFLLLHIRKNKGNDAHETKQYSQVLKFSDSKSSSTKPQKGSVEKGRYPAEKLKL
ncbi:hypothetical protein OROHE_017149 [Orobanche hederae]